MKIGIYIIETHISLSVFYADSCADVLDEFFELAILGVFES
jgi:hypothetical protein